MSKAWIVGEALADLIPDHNGDERIGEQRYRAVIGGGAANTARALARLGKSCEWIGSLSTDRFGHMAWMALEGDGVGLDLSYESDQKSAKAILDFDETGVARYRFELQESATFSFDRQWLAEGSVEILHIGSLATVVEPGRSALISWVREKREDGAYILFDPNVRPAFLSDRHSYQVIVEEWIALSDIVKASDEEIAWLYPDRTIEEVWAAWLERGPELIVTTRAGAGISAISRHGFSVVDGVKVALVDTVGAGDTVGAVLIEALLESGRDSLHGERLREVLHRASHAAAITCSREGAAPPTKGELELFIRARNPSMKS